MFARIRHPQWKSEFGKDSVMVLSHRGVVAHCGDCGSSEFLFSTNRPTHWPTDLEAGEICVPHVLGLKNV